MLSTAELTALQAVATSALDTTADIQRNTPAADGYGHQTASWAPIATGVRCGLAKPNAHTLAAYAGLIGSLSVWLISLPYGTTVRVSPTPDRIVTNGQTLQVVADLSISGYSTLVQVLASEVR